MSKIKVNSLEGVGASTPAISIDNASGTCTANLTNRTNKNLVINGACLIAQRGTSETGSAANGYSTVDRFQLQQNGTDAYPGTAQGTVASGTTPYTNGFRKTFKVTNGNQSTAGAGDELGVRYSIEAQDVATSGWNYTSSSSNVTLSFWVKSSVAQNFYGYLLTLDGTMQRYAFETGALSADTWTKVTKTISGNSNITIDNNNGEGFRIEWRLFSGTDFTDSGVSLNTWAAFAGGTRTPDYGSAMDDWYLTNNATFEITGLQLEVSDHATDFEHRSFVQELALCQRYCVVTTRLPAMANNASGYISCCSRPNPVPMRAAPSVALGGTLRYNPYFGSGEHTTTTTPTLQANVEDNFVINFSGWSGTTPTNVFGDVYNTTITINAEL